MIRPVNFLRIFVRNVSVKQLKDYKFPEIKTEDCEQKYISGWGPGGQKVNTAQNAVMLRHKPTGITVKVHESRLLSDNIDIAFERLKLAVDRQLNGENSYQAQLEKIQKEIEFRRNKKRQKQRTLKEKLKNEGQNSADCAEK